MRVMMNPPASWLNEFKRLKRRVQNLEKQDELVVFYGSSSLRLWVTIQKDLAPINVLNLAFGGSSFAWCIHYFEDLFTDVLPSKVVLYGGDNDLSDNLTAEQVLTDYKELVEMILAKYPEVEISTISLKPSPSRVHLLPAVREVNKGIQSYLQGINGCFIDIHDKMLLAKGIPNSGLFMSDDLHMNKIGYKIWADAVNYSLRNC